MEETRLDLFTLAPTPAFRLAPYECPFLYIAPGDAPSHGCPVARAGISATAGPCSLRRGPRILDMKKPRTLGWKTEFRGFCFGIYPNCSGSIQSTDSFESA